MHLGPSVGMHDCTQRHVNVWTMEVFSQSSYEPKWHCLRSLVSFCVSLKKMYPLKTKQNVIRVRFHVQSREAAKSVLVSIFYRLFEAGSDYGSLLYFSRASVRIKTRLSLTAAQRQ